MMIWMKENGINVELATPIDGASRNTGNGNEPGTTGTVYTDKLNNIYDLLGNCFEVTLETYNIKIRTDRRW